MRCYSTKTLLRFAVCITLAGFLLPVSLAQSGAGSISGVVSDTAEAVIPAAEVRIRNAATGVTRQGVTNETGYFTFTGVQPAVYELSVTAKGFKVSLRKGLELQVGQSLRSDTQLEVGDLVQTVEIQSTALLLESASAKIGTVVETKQVTELPLNGRQFGQLILLTPGALPIALGQSTALKVQLGAGSYSPVINGQRSRFNNFTLDGVENNDPMFNSYAMNPSVDAIQEFSVQSRGGVSEQGRSMGSDIVVVTRSGTNQYRGSLFEFLRNTKLDARNFFDPVRPTFKQNQFGGTFGGPLRLPKYNGRDRTFFFGYYEGFQFVRSSNNIATVPTEAMRNGDFSEAGQPLIYDILTTRADATVPGGFTRGLFPGNRLPSGRINQTAQNLMKTVYPSPTSGGFTRNFTNTDPRRQESDQASTRIDHKVSNNNSLFGRISYNDGYNSTPGDIPSVGTFLTNTAWNATVGDTHVFRPNLIGHFQWGFNRYTSNRVGKPLPDAILQATGWDKVFPNGPPDLLMLSLGITDIAASGGSFTPIGPHNYFQNIADVTWIKGQHSFKAGLTVSYLNSFQASPQASIGFERRPTSNLVDLRGTGHGAATFLLGLPTDARRAAGDSSAKLSQFEYHGFLQDEFRATKSLTITAGIRYSYVQAMKEARNAYSGLDVFTGNYLLAVKNPVTGAGPNLRERWVDPDWNNFAPRIGLAYLLGQKTTIRAGAGIYYSFTDFVQVFGDPAGNWPFGFSQSVGPLNDFTVDAALSNPFSNSAGAELPRSPEGQGGFSINPRMRTPYSAQWNFSIQRQLPGELLADLSYVGSNSVKLYQARLENQAIPGPGPVQSRRPFPNYTGVTWNDNGAPSNYNGLSLKFQKRYGSGLSFLTSSTWGHNLDVWSTERRGTTGGPQNPLNWRPDYASSTADMKLTWLFSDVYELPFGKGKRWLTTGVARHVLGNWQWSNIVGLYGGQPINVSLGFDNASLGQAGGQRPNVSGSPVLSSGRTRLRWFDTSVFSQPAQFQFGRPTAGAWVTYGLGSESRELPGFVVLSSGRGTSAGSNNWSSGFLPSTHQGVVFRSSGDPILYLTNPPGISRQTQQARLGAINKLNAERYRETGDSAIATRIQSYELAFRMQMAAPKLLDFSDEKPATLEMYGVTQEPARPYATNCLLARRMVERGVRFVMLAHASWDDHQEINKKLKKNCDITDQPVAALIKDLKQRGLLDSTLLVWGGEFGRTPMAEQQHSWEDAGRDHHPNCFSMWLAGGGIKGGQVIGKTDELGMNGVEERVHVHDLHATMLHCLGMDHKKLTYRHMGRDFRLTDVSGQVVEKMIA